MYSKALFVFTNHKYVQLQVMEPSVMRIARKQQNVPKTLCGKECSQNIVTLTKELNVHLLQGMDAAKLVEFMMDLIEDECLVIIRSKIPHNVMN